MSDDERKYFEMFSDEPTAQELVDSWPIEKDGADGMAICVYRPGWFVGSRNRITLNMDYLPDFDSNQLYARMRLS